MTATVDITQTVIFTALRACLVDVLPVDPGNIVRGQQNRVPMPGGVDFVIMTLTGERLLSKTVRTYDPSDDPAPALGKRYSVRHTQFNVQLDCYGGNSQRNAQIVATLVPDLYGCDYMRPYAVQPLYCDDPVQLPLTTGEDQYLERWTVPLALQANPTVSTAQDFADIVAVSLMEADQNG